MVIEETVIAVLYRKFTLRINILLELSSKDI